MLITMTGLGPGNRTGARRALGWWVGSDNGLMGQLGVFLLVRLRIYIGKDVQKEG